jgi:SAM-dependent methyltransferase
VNGDDHGGGARRVYDASAVEYVAFVGTELSNRTEDAVDRAVLAAFAELAEQTSTGRPIGDLGCGPGRVAAFLSRAGLDTIGIDVSSRLALLGRDAHPDIPFAVGDISELPLADQSLGGAVSWYSIIYTPEAQLDRMFDELARVVVPGGPVLLAFQAGPAEPIPRSDAFGSGHPLTSYHHAPEVVAVKLEAASFSLHATTLRRPARDHEAASQAFVLAHRLPRWRADDPG